MRRSMKNSGPSALTILTYVLSLSSSIVWGLSGGGAEKTVDGCVVRFAVAWALKIGGQKVLVNALF